ncbi:uncharacterized protein KNAG_0A01980 [Huiozyma naganishii CBS 8797]|uniref:Uncharacterized protein n=1 Tax=Huiozyma naganishii (strain ATCC MYA-139 / BCRC 22969 / CBS 8797 / KCTC 17520 / NBRC 10181 / NCYC 3082 / Yp74L-3) TaxID=1071383 RepID=J7RT53_HUIN7|nr:hypothetical protein KNAG_0A01980 [Kazachstania naganishii CBS 8797]CCK67887.1 hypothetical protein KNAG_0A01980 [Kazachstania naganishii CBS 8797]
MRTFKVKRVHSPDVGGTLESSRYKRQRLIQDFERLSINAGPSPSEPTAQETTKLVCRETAVPEDVAAKLARGEGVAPTVDSQIHSTVLEWIRREALQVVKWVDWDRWLYVHWLEWWTSKFSVDADGDVDVDFNAVTEVFPNGTDYQENPQVDDMDIDMDSP